MLPGQCAHSLGRDARLGQKPTFQPTCQQQREPKALRADRTSQRVDREGRLTDGGRALLARVRHSAALLRSSGMRLFLLGKAALFSVPTTLLVTNSGVASGAGPKRQPRTFGFGLRFRTRKQFNSALARQEPTGASHRVLRQGEIAGGDRQWRAVARPPAPPHGEQCTIHRQGR